jgi:phosphoribosylcarboxyaminoimidazole (NCAIR) mutase
VIGVPLDSSSLNGLDALLATVQMPAGVPVATMESRLEQFKKEIADKVAQKAETLRQGL